MHKLFNLTSVTSQGITKFADWLYVKDGLRRNIGAVIRFARRNPMAVESSHFLVRLLQSITVPQSQNLERYYDNVDAISLNMSMALKMTSSIFQGQLWHGVFYGRGNREVLIANSESFDIFEAHRNWENLCPVKVLQHSKSDLGLNIPDGTNTGSESGLAVISINIPMLAIQYRAFRFNEMNVAGDDSQRSVMQFVRMYVLPNMLFSHLDHAIFNRLANLQKGAPLGESKKQHSFYLTDYSVRLQQVHALMLAHLNKTSNNFTTILRTIPAVTKNNMEELLLLPDLAPTRQVTWGLVLARLPSTAFLFSVAHSWAETRNRTEINMVKRDILAYRTNNLMRATLPLEMYYAVEDDFNAILALSK